MHSFKIKTKNNKKILSFKAVLTAAQINQSHIPEPYFYQFIVNTNNQWRFD